MRASILAKLATLRAQEQPIPLITLLNLFERASWQTMQANNWAGFKALVKVFGPVSVPAPINPSQAFPFILCSYELSKIAEITGINIHDVGLTVLYDKYPALNNEVSNKAN